MSTGGKTLFQQQILTSLRPRNGLLVFILSVCLTAVVTFGVVKLDLRPNGNDAFAGLIILDLCILIFLGFGPFTNVIAAEKDAGTLGSLRITALSPAELLFAKSTSLYARTLLIFVAQLPFASFCITVGEIGYGKIFASFTLLAALGWLACNMGLFCSVIAKTARHAGQLMLVTTAAVCSMPRILSHLGKSWTSTFPIKQTIASLNFYSIIERTLTKGEFPWLAVTFYAVVGLIFFAAATALFERMAESHTEKPAAKSAERKKISRNTRVATRPGKRPLTWREFHYAAGGWKGIRYRWIGYFGIPIAAGLIAFVTDAKANISEVIGITSIYCGALGLFSEIPYSASRIFGLEVTEKTIESLVILPISTYRMLREKMLGVLPTFIPSTVATILGIVLFYANSNETKPSSLNEPLLWLTLICALSIAALFLMFTINSSIVNPRTSFLATFLGTTFLVQLIFWITERMDIPLAVTLPTITLTSLGILRCVFRLFPETLQRAGSK